MKIVQVFSNIHFAHGTGQSGLPFKIYKALKSHDFNVNIISNTEEPLEKLEFLSKDVINNTYALKGKASLKTYLLGSYKVFTYLKKCNPNLLHVHGRLLIPYIYLINLLCDFKFVGRDKSNKRVFICSVTDSTDRMTFVSLKILAYCLKRSVKVYVSSDYIKNQLEKIGVPSGKIEILRLGIAKKFFIQRSLPTKYDVIFFGDSRYERGFDLVYSIAKNLKNVHFLVLIRWEYEECKELLLKVKNLSNVIVLNYPYEEHFEDLLLQSRIIFLPYRWMGVQPPISVLESMALGKCLITSGLPGTLEVVKHNHNGVIIDVDDVEGIKANIASLLDNPRFVKSLGNAARKTMLEMYTDTEYNKIIDFYDSL